MENVLSKVRKEDVIMDPFPHIVIKNAISDELCQQLLAEFPSTDQVTKGQDWGSNKRFNLSSKDVADSTVVSQVWKDFIEANHNQQFYNDFVRVFKDAILSLYPNFEQQFKPLGEFKSGVRKMDDFSNADILIDSLISINTPVATKPNSVRAGHVDAPDKLFTGLLYLRSPEDNTQGGNLEIYRYKKRYQQNKAQGHWINAEIESGCIDLVKTVTYENNVLVMFINSLESLHGVTVREKTDRTRTFMNLVGEINGKLYTMKPLQSSRFRRKVRASIKRFTSGISAYAGGGD
ncbi:MAG TPA: hypothetical protein PKA00_13375 [Saprospiraceae bacterium]|nr:hypothetical protein [Saprospiraceae bacterium]HMQ83900.1 hypothetical protein [Saprospiraceae bacterium]